MIKIEKIHVDGWTEAIMRGMRNPMNSWDKSDSYYDVSNEPDELWPFKEYELKLGENDKKLATKLAKAGGPHAKFRRMIIVYMDITAPLYWWKEFDTYKVGTVANSCSTMHKIHSRELTIDDFSHEHLNPIELELLKQVIQMINTDRELYLRDKQKADWWQMIQLLPSSYNQKRTVMLNYEVLSEIYKWRHDHKLDEWVMLCNYIKEELPYAKELII